MLPPRPGERAPQREVSENKTLLVLELCLAHGERFSMAVRVIQRTEDCTGYSLLLPSLFQSCCPPSFPRHPFLMGCTSLLVTLVWEQRDLGDTLPASLGSSRTLTPLASMLAGRPKPCSTVRAGPLVLTLLPLPLVSSSHTHVAVLRLGLRSSNTA